MFIAFLLIIIGFAALIFGANWLVNGASVLAKQYNVSDLAIGLTIVAFGTSAPELVVNAIASVKGYSDIVLGNIVGSNNFNLFIILGISGLIAPIVVQSSTAWKEIPISLVATLLVVLLINDFNFSTPSELGRLEGALLLLLFGLFLYYVFKQMKDDPAQQTEVSQQSSLRVWGMIILGLAGLVGGGQLVVMNSISIANDLGVSEKIIGLTIVAAGTSLPELVTSVIAATKKKSDIAIGNVIGSNVFNILLVLPISSLVHPIDFNPKFNQEFFILMGGTILLLLFMWTGKRKKLDRWEAGLLAAFYLGYTTYLVLQAGQ
ncbi:MAG TPA: calcium/sodium antiporter [Saprospiraceae bacterium]|nr:calcium/sodium antiporter [Saprospiraceae bacterium]